MDELTTRAFEAIKHLTNGRARITYFLATEGKSTAGTIRRECEVGNISDMVSHLNPVLRKFGLNIINYPPDKPLLNSFGEKTAVHFWELSLLDA
jgi:hypothetical protein